MSLGCDWLAVRYEYTVCGLACTHFNRGFEVAQTYKRKPEHIFAAASQDNNL